jgi:hypothetical protein
MSLPSIISNIVKKDDGIDRKKLAYFFRDHHKVPATDYSIALLLRILAPKNIIILSVQELFLEKENETPVDYLQEIIPALLPDTKLTVVYGDAPGGDTAALTLREGSPIERDKLLSTDLGLIISREGSCFIYHGPSGIPANVKLRVQKPDPETLEEIRKADLDVILPTQDMFMVTDLVKAKVPDIKICYFLSKNKTANTTKVMDIVRALLSTNIRTSIKIHYFDDDFATWDTDSETVNLFSEQSDYLLVIRDNRVDVHLEFENGHVPKERAGWLLLN